MFDTMNREEWLADDGNTVAVPSRRGDRTPDTTTTSASPDRYGAGRGINIPAALIILGFHIALLIFAITARTIYVRKEEAKLAVVNLMPPAPPPPAQDKPPPPPPEVNAPPPIVRTPVPVQTVTVIDRPVTRPVAISYVPPAPVVAAPAPSSIIKAADLGTRMIAGKPPRYPVESRRKHEQGTVVLSVVLGTDGKVATITIAQSSGHSRLDEAAREAVERWRWEPVLVNGQPMRVSGLVEIPFQLQG